MHPLTKRMVRNKSITDFIQNRPLKRSFNFGFVIEIVKSCVMSSISMDDSVSDPRFTEVESVDLVFVFILERH